MVTRKSKEISSNLPPFEKLIGGDLEDSLLSTGRREVTVSNGEPLIRLRIAYAGRVSVEDAAKARHRRRSRDTRAIAQLKTRLEWMFFSLLNHDVIPLERSHE